MVHITNPVEAKEIGAQCGHFHDLLREARTADALKDAWRAWVAYADSRHVCRQIRDHMAGVYAATNRGLDKPIIRDPSTGEAA